MEPSAYLGLALLATLLGAVVFSGGGDDDDDQSAPEPQPTNPEGTEGADDIRDYVPENDADNILSTLGGNDTVSLAYMDESATIDAGEGDDELILIDVNGIVAHGGNGDDSFTLNELSHTSKGINISGDAGDDRIEVGGTSFAAANLSLSGGDGNDTIAVADIFAAPVSNNDAAGVFAPTMSGGEGNDQFNLSLELRDWQNNAEQANPPEPYALGTITDFNSGKDQLNIDLKHSQQQGNYLGHEIIHSEDGQSTGVLFKFTPLGETAPVQESVLWLKGTESVTDADLNIKTFTAPHHPAVTEGADDVTTSRAFHTLQTLGGDDTISGVASAYLDAGAGDDELYLSDASNSKTYANDGDDLIAVAYGDEASISGGKGSDTISVFQNWGMNNGLNLQGDDGDDQFQIISETNYTFVLMNMSGGAGSDTFDLTIKINEDNWRNIGENAVVGGDPDIVVDGALHLDAATIADFKSGEDKLRIDPTSMMGDATYLGYELIKSDNGDSTGVALRYRSAEEGVPDLHSILWLTGTASISESDLSFVNLPNDAQSLSRGE